LSVYVLLVVGLAACKLFNFLSMVRALPVQIRASKC